MGVATAMGGGKNGGMVVGGDERGRVGEGGQTGIVEGDAVKWSGGCEEEEEAVVVCVGTIVLIEPERVNGVSA